MGGKKQTTQNSTSSSTSNSSMGSTGTAMSWLDDFENSFRDSLAQGPYTGDVVAAPGQLDQYAPGLGNISGTVADPGAVNTWKPTIDILDRYVAGMDPRSTDSLNQGYSFLQGITPQIQQGATDMAGFWGDVAGGKYLDPNTNQPLQNYLSTFTENADDNFAKNELAYKQGAIESGAFGDDSYRRAEMWRGDEQGQNVQAALSSIIYGNYSDEMARRERATGGMSDALTLGMQPTTIGDSIGERFREGSQLDINNSLATNQERERADLAGFQNDERIRNQTALRDQAGLDNNMGMARWTQEQDALRIQNETIRAQIDQAIRQAGLTNDMARFENGANYDMSQFQNFFSTLANPVFGQRNTSSGTQNTTTTQSTPAWQNALGAISGIAGAAGALTGNPLLMGAGALGKGMSGGEQGPAPTLQGSSPYTPPQMSYTGYAPQVPQAGGTPWYMQPGAFNYSPFAYGG